MTTIKQEILRHPYCPYTKDMLGSLEKRGLSLSTILTVLYDVEFYKEYCDSKKDVSK